MIRNISLRSLQVTVLFAAASIVYGQDRVIDGEPFDEITLDEANNNAVLRTLPLELKNRVVPEKPDPLFRLRLRLADRPKRLYECEWQYIVKVRLFEQIVLEGAEDLVAKGDFNEAFEYYDYLLTNYPRWPGLHASIDTFLYKQAVFEVKSGQHEQALTLLTELATRNAARKNLDRAYESIAARVIADRVKQNRFDAARGVISLVAAKFANTPLPKVEALRGKMIAEATSLRDLARKELAAGEIRKAQLASHRALAIWPDLDGVRELARAIDEKYPVVMVGTLQPSGAATSRTLDDWPSRRVERLLARQFVELVGFSTEGGIYRCPLGSLSRDDSGTRWSIQIRPGIPGADGTLLTGYEIARRLLALPQRYSRNQYDAWRDVFRGVAVKQVYGVQIELARPLVRPERLLQAAEAVPVPWPGLSGDKTAQTPGFLRPYELGEIGPETHFYAHQGYFALDTTQPQELIEQHFADPDDAIKALRRGEIDVLDRVCPWDVGLLASSKSIALSRYALPTVHVLLPNSKRPLPGNRTFRRAILYGINRQVILERALLADRPQPGSIVVSGPFAAGSSVNDAIGYGSSDSIKPAPYEPRLSMALFGIAMKELHPEAKPDAPPQSKEQNNPFVLAHAAEPIARLACASIAEQLKRLGLECELREFDPGKNSPGDDYDFLYTELAAWEPVADARRLLGEQGLTGGCSPYMSLALAKLERAETWKEIRRRLGEIHRIAANELVVIPLWQTVNFFAYRRGAIDVEKQPVVLYQNVELWKQTQPVASR